MGLKKNRKKFEDSLDALCEKNTASERMRRPMVCMSYAYTNINYEFLIFKYIV